jgi:hypothetical protein
MAEGLQFGDDGTHSYGKKPVGVSTEFTELKDHGYPRQNLSALNRTRSEMPRITTVCWCWGGSGPDGPVWIVLARSRQLSSVVSVSLRLSLQVEPLTAWSRPSSILLTSTIVLEPPHRNMIYTLA